MAQNTAMGGNTADSAADRVRRVRGLPLMLGVVLCGLLPAVWFHWVVPREERQVAGRLAAAPADSGQRLATWLEFGEPMIQTRLQKLRFSTRHPWLITHTVADGAGEPQIWGLDLASTRPARVVRDGLRVELHLAHPRLLGRGVLRGDNAERVPRYAAGEQIPDPAARAAYLVSWFLEGVIAALPEDIEGAELVLLVDPPGPDEVAEAGAGG